MKVPSPLAFVLCSFIWGTTWYAIRVIVDPTSQGLAPLWGASLRFFMAGVILLALLWSRQDRLVVRRVDAAVAGFFGLVVFGLDYGLIYWGEQFIPSGLTAILFATMPLFVGLFSALLIAGERWTLRHGAGVLLGLGGLVLVFREHLGFDGSSLIPMLAIVVSAAAAAIGSVVMKKYARDSDPYFLNGGAMIVGAIGLLAASLTTGEVQSLPRTTAAWEATLYLALLGSVVSFLLYFDLLHDWGANRSSLITLITPVVAVVTGALLLQERLTRDQIMGSLLVLGGVALSLFHPRLRASTPAVSAGGK